MIAELANNPAFGIIIGTGGMIVIMAVAFWVITRP
jgi:hypothetical protein